MFSKYRKTGSKWLNHLLPVFFVLSNKLSQLVIDECTKQAEVLTVQRQNVVSLAQTWYRRTRKKLPRLISVSWPLDGDVLALSFE